MKLAQLKQIVCLGKPSVRYACEALMRDFVRVGQASLPFGAEPFAPGSITVCTADRCPEQPDIPTEPEVYTLKITDSAICVIGADERGAIYGVYRLSRLLGVPDGIRFMSVQLKPCEAVANGCYRSEKAAYRLRGWFINDEDLLTGWHIGAERPIDYPWYHTVLTVETMDYCVETALRMGINFIIPGSMLDIMNPEQEKLVAYCVDHGLMVSQHHIEPLGVSHFFFADYARKLGVDETFSFLHNREGVCRVWRAYAEKWAEYSPNVIWQLGLRGKADRPVWESETPTAAERKAWGAVISDAIATQYEIIHDADKGACLSTATLWMEGTALAASGDLHFPSDTVLVFADVGPTQMLSEDFYILPREARGYGLYDHVCYWNAGPHLVQGTDWRKMAYNIRQALEKGDNAYDVVNVSNIRDFIPTLAAHSRLTQAGLRFDVDRAYREIAAEYYGNAAFGALLSDYFRALPCCENQTLEHYYARFFTFRHGVYDDFSYCPATDTWLRLIGLQALDGETEAYWPARLTESIRQMDGLIQTAEQTAGNGYAQTLIFQLRFMRSLMAWCRCCCAYGDGDRGALRESLAPLTEMLRLQKSQEFGEFENWYRGDDKVNIRGIYEQTKQKLLEEKG